MGPIRFEYRDRYLSQQAAPAETPTQPEQHDESGPMSIDPQEEVGDERGLAESPENLEVEEHDSTNHDDAHEENTAPDRHNAPAVRSPVDAFTRRTSNPMFDAQPRRDKRPARQPPAASSASDIGTAAEDGQAEVRPKRPKVRNTRDSAKTSVGAGSVPPLKADQICYNLDDPTARSKPNFEIRVMYDAVLQTWAQQLNDSSEWNGGKLQLPPKRHHSDRHNGKLSLHVSNKKLKEWFASTGLAALGPISEINVTWAPH